jgi:hypothetical protein
MAAASNALEDLLPLVPSVLSAMASTAPGQVRRIQT